jgi:DedD protein
VAREAERLAQEFERETAPAADPAPQREAAGPTPGAAARSAPGPAPQSPLEPAPRGAAGPAAGPRAEPAPHGSASARSAAGTIVVQVLSTADPAKARQTLTGLQEGGYPATLSTFERGGALMYRVRLGPYRDRPAAEKVADEVRRKFKVDTWITSE